MITLEKLLLLKSVTLFKHVPDDLLLHLVSSIVQEKRVNAGANILKKGQSNAIMYIIASGVAKVHDEDGLVIKELNTREIFGELSTLTGQSPVNNVSAATDCLLLTIRGDAFYDLMSIEPDILRGVILTLCERAQNMSYQISELMNNN